MWDDSMWTSGTRMSSAHFNLTAGLQLAVYKSTLFTWTSTGEAQGVLLAMRAWKLFIGKQMLTLNRWGLFLGLKLTEFDLNHFSAFPWDPARKQFLKSYHRKLLPLFAAWEYKVPAAAVPAFALYRLLNRHFRVTLISEKSFPLSITPSEFKAQNML